MHNKEKEKDPLDPQTVFTIKHSEIPKGITQCKEHKWQKISENELYCPVCQSGALINPKDMKLYVE